MIDNQCVTTGFILFKVENSNININESIKITETLKLNKRSKSNVNELHLMLNEKSQISDSSNFSNKNDEKGQEST